MAALNVADRELLGLLQSDFPLAAQPYTELGGSWAFPARKSFAASGSLRTAASCGKSARCWMLVSWAIAAPSLP